MIVVRVVRGVTGHFPMRVSDWFLSVMCFNFGWILWSPTPTFAISPSFKYMEGLMSEKAWGYWCLSVGALRIMALFVNGTFPKFRWSPHIRFICALLTCFVWFQVALSLELSGANTTGLAIYKYLLLFDIFNAFLAASEAGSAERVHRDGRS